MKWLASLRRRLEVRVLNATATSFRPGDLVLVSVGARHTDEYAVLINDALQRRFPEVRFQLLTDKDVALTVIQHAGCNGGCHRASDSTSNGHHDRSAADAGNDFSQTSAASPKASADRDGLSYVVLTVDIPPKQHGNSGFQAHDLSGENSDRRGVAGEATGATHA